MKALALTLVLLTNQMGKPIWVARENVVAILNQAGCAGTTVVMMNGQLCVRETVEEVVGAVEKIEARGAD